MCINIKSIATITICGSAKFVDKIDALKTNLEKMGFDVYGVKGYSDEKESTELKKEYNLIKEHFLKIEKS